MREALGALGPRTGKDGPVKRTAIVTALLAILALGAGCASSRRRSSPYLGLGGYGGAKWPQLSTAEAPN